jgi:hypothetical protein
MHLRNAIFLRYIPTKPLFHHFPNLALIFLGKERCIKEDVVVPRVVAFASVVGRVHAGEVGLPWSWGKVGFGVVLKGNYDGCGFAESG